MLVWFRNDLRLNDNPALSHAIEYYGTKKQSHKLGGANNEPPCLNALFFVSKQQWKKFDWSDIKIDLIIRHVWQLKADLLEHNIHLNIVEADYFDDQIRYLERYNKQNPGAQIFANAELEVDEQQRDAQCKTLGISLNLFESDVIVPKGKVLNQSGEMFKVFTPFKRAWLNYVRANGVEYLGKLSSVHTQKSCTQAFNIQTSDTQASSTQASTTQASSTNQDSVITRDVSNLSLSWPLSTLVEKQVVPEFLDKKLSGYSKQRDIPSVKGTSGLSPYLAIGAISPRYLLLLLLNRSPDLLTSTDDPTFSWLNELIWRDFYRHLIYHFEKLSKHQVFNVKYKNTQWPSSPALFEAWCNAKTGYPIVDAAMRQLNQTGWMHNRLRMIVASFLTKHLLIDWRLGEKYFMQHLIDGDLAANNGGWQWAAGTGCDAQPYFRIFNPIRQSERFDPNGDFIRKFLPELQNIPNKDIHFPHKFIEKNELSIYWPAVVEHKVAREQALAFYKR